MIISEGVEWYSKIGTKTSKGTKVFSLAGAVKNTGLIEVPMGTTLRDVVFQIGGGTPNKRRKFKAIQVGGPLGGCYSESKLDLTVDYETMKRYYSTIGSGGLVVLDNSNCIVDFARHLMGFVQEESCGKCAPCRLGTEVMYEILEKITKGEGQEEDIDTLFELGEDVHDFTLCGLGQMAPNPVLTSIEYFREEYEAHIRDKTCPAHVCKALHKFYVDPDSCTKCGICFKKSCKFEAIKWAPKTVAEIDTEKCTKCGICIRDCPFMAIF
jgi:NADH:ubiquinone oxidoreductase subunit F (NADH-binding)